MCLQVYPRALVECALVAAGLLRSKKRKYPPANGWIFIITSNKEITKPIGTLAAYPCFHNYKLARGEDALCLRLQIFQSTQLRSVTAMKIKEDLVTKPFCRKDSDSWYNIQITLSGRTQMQKNKEKITNLKSA